MSIFERNSRNTDYWMRWHRCAFDLSVNLINSLIHTCPNCPKIQLSIEYMIWFMTKYLNDDFRLICFSSCVTDLLNHLTHCEIELVHTFQMIVLNVMLNIVRVLKVVCLRWILTIWMCSVSFKIYSNLKHIVNILYLIKRRWRKKNKNWFIFSYYWWRTISKFSAWI